MRKSNATLQGELDYWRIKSINADAKLEAAERRVAELAKEQDEHDAQISTMEGKFNLAKRALDSKAERCSKAEAELARRDAAAGEPVAWVVLAPQGDYIERNSEVVAHLEGTGLAKCRPLYAAPLPAVLPPEPSGHDCPALILDPFSWICGAGWMREKAQALGCQSPKEFVVKMPHTHQCMSTAWEAADDYKLEVIEAIKAAGGSIEE